MDAKRTHALVLGASMGGLLAARALSEHYDHVTVVDPDTLPPPGQHRRGVPQSRHAHALLARGRAALEELFPGLTDGLVAQGALARDMEALALQACLRAGDQDLAERYFGRVAALVDVPWDLVVGTDLRFPEVVGPRTLKVRMVNRYIARLHVAAQHDAEVGRAFLQVINLMARPETLMRPRIAYRVWGATAHQRGRRAWRRRRWALTMAAYCDGGWR